MSTSVQSQNNLFMMLQQARSDTERGSQATNLARDLMQIMGQIGNILMAIVDVIMKVLGAISG